MNYRPPGRRYWVDRLRLKQTVDNFDWSPEPTVGITGVLYCLIGGTHDGGISILGLSDRDHPVPGVQSCRSVGRLSWFISPNFRPATESASPAASWWRRVPDRRPARGRHLRAGTEHRPSDQP